jgi:phosphatidylethanolamine/phosphatidyl-N-methylethanolamine N-methyltransferase
MSLTKISGLFFVSWLCHPLQVGAIAPSGRALGRAVARAIDPGRDAPVIELGAGTGSLTEAILDAGLPAERLVLVEMNPKFCDVLSERYPGVRVICGDAARLRMLVHGIAERAQAVVSGLPLLSMPRRIQEAILSQSMELLDTNGTFVQFTYSLGAPVPKSVTQAVGLHGRRVAHVWSNLPPASVWHFTPATARAGHDGTTFSEGLLPSPG